MLTNKELYKLLYKAIRGDKPNNTYKGRGKVDDNGIELPLNCNPYFRYYSIKCLMSVTKYSNGVVFVDFMGDALINKLKSYLVGVFSQALVGIKTINFSLCVDFVFFNDDKFFGCSNLFLLDDITYPMYNDVPEDKALAVFDKKLKVLTNLICDMKNSCFRLPGDGVKLVIEYDMVKSLWYVSIFGDYAFKKSVYNEGDITKGYVYSMSVKIPDYSQPTVFNSSNVIAKNVEGSVVSTDNEFFRLVFDYLNSVNMSGISSFYTEYYSNSDNVYLTCYRVGVVGIKTITNRKV